MNAQEAMQGPSGAGMGMQKMHQMMTQMMPHCLGAMLPNIPKNERVEFALTLVGTLMDQGCAGMSEQEKREFRAKVVARAQA